MKKSYKISTLLSGVILAGGMLLSSCTDSFDEMNINPNEVTDEELDRDNLRTGAFFTQMQRGVFIVGDEKGAEFQVTQVLCADLFASYVANVKDGYNVVGNRHHDHYQMQSHWYDSPFKDAYTDIMQPWSDIVKVTDEGSVDRALATIVKVLGMNRITDKYGPIPYSKFGTGINVPYDTQEEVYNQFFIELDNAIDVLNKYVAQNSKPYMANYDNIYQGNMNKWLKFANTLRLRLAMRISYVDEAKARTEVQKALDEPCGFLASAADDAILRQSATFSFVNPIYEACVSFNNEGDTHMSATMDCYLIGLNDKRLSAYFSPAKATGEYVGMRNGMTSNLNAYPRITSAPNYKSDDPLTWMHAAEAYFLLAEAKLRLGLGSEEVKDLYEQGIRASFESAGAAGVEAYIADNTSLPKTAWTDPNTKRDTNVSSMLSNLTVAWDDAANDETKLERIMLQKWIALYPDGMEAWSEMRRTGYPGWVRINSYSNGATANGVANNQMISRLPFPSTELANNSANTQEAIQMLGGQNNAGTRLWWDVKR